MTGAARNIPRVSSEMRAQDPEFNWVICHPELDYKFDCERGDDWSHKHEEFDLVIGGTIGCEIYNFRSGEFTRHGDGGFTNIRGTLFQL